MFSLHPPAGPLETALTFPPPSITLTHSTWRNLHTRALLMPNNQTLWTLDARGARWTQDRLAHAAAFLLKTHTLDSVLLNRLRDELDLPDLQARPVHLDDFTTNGWATRSLAVALYLQEAFLVPDGAQPSVSSAALNLFHEELRQQLLLNLIELKARAPAQTMEIALQHPDVFGHIYNYLQQSNAPLYWRQFASAYPIFLKAIVMRDAPWPLQNLADLINDGLPLNEELARTLGITSATLRCLVGIPVRTIGHGWLTQLDTLMESLNQLRPECRPRSDEEWRIFNRVVSSLENRSERSARRSFYVRAWIRETLHNPRDPAWLDRNIQQRHATLVDALFHDCLAVVAHELGLLGISRAIHIPQSVRGIMERWLLHFKPNRLLQFSQQYQEHQTSQRDDEDNLMSTALGERYWPLIPDEFVNSNQSRRIVPLINTNQLEKHGDAMRICLGNLPQYRVDCKQGRAFIVALFDSDDYPVSTAELRVQNLTPSPTEPIRISVAQHTGHRNAPVRAECRKAMADLLEYVGTDAIQKHLRVGLVAQRAYRDGQRSFSMSQLEAHIKSYAMRKTFGEKNMDELVLKCCAALEVALALARRIR